MSYRLGIDLGASSLVAGVRRAAGRPELLTFATGRPYVVVDDVRDLVADTVERVSLSTAGVEANGETWGGALSPDARFVVFRSAATNLVDGDTNGKQDVFRKELATGEIVRLSVTSAGEQGNQDSADPSVSGDGSRTAFRTSATNILPGVTVQGGFKQHPCCNTAVMTTSQSRHTPVQSHRCKITTCVPGVSGVPAGMLWVTDMGQAIGQFVAHGPAFGARMTRPRT